MNRGGGGAYKHPFNLNPQHSPTASPLRYTQAPVCIFSSRLRRHIRCSRSIFCSSGEICENSDSSVDSSDKAVPISSSSDLADISVQGSCWPQLSQFEHDFNNPSTNPAVNFKRESLTSINSPAVISPGKITTAWFSRWSYNRSNPARFAWSRSSAEIIISFLWSNCLCFILFPFHKIPYDLTHFLVPNWPISR